MLFSLSLDKKASANASWQLNSKIPNTETTIFLFMNNTYTSHKVYREFLGITQEGFIAVQDFYVETTAVQDAYATPDDLNYRSDPYLLLPSIDPVIFPYQKPTYGIEGKYFAYYPNGHVESEAYFTQGLLQGSYIHRNDKNHRVSEIYYMNNRVQGIIAYTEEQTIFQQIWGLNLADSIDLAATANAPWEVGGKISGTETEVKVYNFFVKNYLPIYRVFLGMTRTGNYLVQDYFDESATFTEHVHTHGKDYKPQKRTNPYLLLSCADPTTPNYPRSPPEHIEGYYTTWYLSGGLERLNLYEAGKRTLSYDFDEFGKLEYQQDERTHFKEIFLSHGVKNIGA